MYHIYHIHAGVRKLWCLAAFVSLYYSRWFELKKQKMFLPHPRVKVSIVVNLRDREVS